MYLTKKIENYKHELIKRYKYLYENSIYIYALGIRKETKEELDKRKKKERKNDLEPLIIYKGINSRNLLALEFLLLGDIPLEETQFYLELENLKNNKEYLEQLKTNLELIDNIDNLNKTLILWKLISEVRENIYNQTKELKNKKLKLEALDEYYRMLRYKNDGIIRVSGYENNINEVGVFSAETVLKLLSLEINGKKTETISKRDKNNVGVKNNNFINFFGDKSIFKRKITNKSLTEDEKQKVYLSLNDELPWDLETVCAYGDNIENLVRPQQTTPCNRTFFVEEKEIFKAPNGKYYQLCPECGFIVNIDEKIFSPGVKDRIDKRCLEDENLFRKMYLFSELLKLNDIAEVHGKKRILIK